MKIAVYPGSFDPITLGHLNIIKRASRIFDRVYIAVSINSDKRPAFTLEERMDFIKRCTQRFDNVVVECSDKLVVEYAKEKGAGVIIRGLRAMSDFEMEFQMAQTNKTLEPHMDTVFLASDGKYTYLSSSVVREMARYHADLKPFVPREIIEDIQKKYEGDKK